ncbi:MAG: glycosyltransferase [Christensenellales bacterium]
MEKETGKKTVIAQVVGKPAGGVIACVLNFYRNVDREKFKFVFFTYEPSVYDEEISRLGGEVVHFCKAYLFPRSVPELVSLFRKGNYDIVHVHMSTLSVFPLLAAKIAGCGTRICHAHTTGNIKERFYFAKRILRPFVTLFATDLIACSRYAAEWTYGNKSAFILHNAIDLSRFSPNGSKVKNVVGTVGRLVQQKNHLFLIDVIKSVRERNPDVSLIITGEGKLKKRIEKQIKRKGMQDYAFVRSERADIENFYDEISLFVLPSLFEGLPIVGVEAQAKGLPCLFSDKITQEVSVGGETAFLPLVKEKWINGILESLQKGSAVNKISDDYDIEKEAKKLEKYYGDRA